ncbi:MAG: NUDIX domain-containing protein [Candidatus Diapherotrites archaeon]|nr:NUDIX domain-containing protein [Candidatus Diapherotrites archaeon]
MDKTKPDFLQFEKGVFLVNCLAIVFDKTAKKILIGKRENDPFIKELSWGFPGGRPGYEKDLEIYMQEEVKKKTNLDVNVGEVLFAKTYPEKREFLSIYFLCTPKSGVEKAGEKFIEIKWVEPTKITDFFTTSIHPKLISFLEKLENS